VEFHYRYSGSSAVESRADRSQLSFSPDTRRDPTFFRGELRKGLPFREAISALNDVVVSNLRWRPKDREAYKIWVQAEEQRELAEQLAHGARAKQELQQLHVELTQLEQRFQHLRKGYYEAQARYFDRLYRRDYNAWYVLDPVITVHPDEIFFECFSQDESSYARLGVDYEVFKNIGEFACGTTNIDYSAELYDEFQKIRSYKKTEFVVDPSGFEVQTQSEISNSESFKELKIDLPDSWVRGFLQVNSAMSLPMISFDLHPMDIHNFLFILRRHKEREGPRSMRYLLKPGEPVQVIFEPWNIKVECPRSIYSGAEEHEVRVWGRRRLYLLERLIPIARRFRVQLLGTGMPSFYVADLGDLSFTLGLSGWTANDWSQAGNFDLMAPRAEVEPRLRQRIFETLRRDWRADPEALAREMGLERATVLGALSAYSQAGRAIFDLNKGVYRARELSQDPLPMKKLRFSNEREENARRTLDADRVWITEERRDPQGYLHLNGHIRDGKKYNTRLIIDADQRITEGQCGCSWYGHNKLFKGPCQHMLALRLKQSQKRFERFGLR